MNVKPDGGDYPIVVSSTNLSSPLSIGQQVDGFFRLGCSYARLAKDGRHAWAIDLYQRKAIVTGKALASDVPGFPKDDSIVRVKGQLAAGDAGMYLWVRELVPAIAVSPDICGLDLATPNWVINQEAVDRLSAIWNTLAAEYRELINAVLADTDVLRGFLMAPGSLRHHDAETGGCLAHTVRVATMAMAISDLSPELNRDLLVTGAIVHDIGKSIEYSQNKHGRWTMTRFGKQVGHKVGGALLISAAAKQCQLLTHEQEEDILHMLTCSFAPTWAGYRTPSTLEAMALSAIDRLCAGKVAAH